eukprot:scaffold99113_cov33-Phaeocystis_antarctica.AAC.1
MTCATELRRTVTNTAPTRAYDAQLCATRHARVCPPDDLYGRPRLRPHVSLPVCLEGFVTQLEA